MKKIIGLVFITMLFFFLPSASQAAPPVNFQNSLVVGSGLEGPSGFDIAPDGRIFILQRTGEVKIYKAGQLLPQNFTVLASMASGDRGLIGIAFDPDFLTNHYVYFYYTGLDLLNRLVRFTAATDTATDGPVVLYQTSDQSFQLHVGGTIRFGLDGKLYVSIGDNGYSPNAQSLSNPHGKILRLNKDGSIPTDNPFYGQIGKLPEIYAYGFRNPFRFTFDSVTGRMYEGDVGEATWEEINRVVPGGNYGWPVCEGACMPAKAGLIDPIYQWNHNGKSAASVAGIVYHGQQFPPDYQGRLFFGDYALGFIKTMSFDASGNNTGVFDFDSRAGSVVDMKEDARDGSLYYITYIPGALYKITYSTGNHVPVANATSDVTKGTNPLTVHFSSQGSYDPDGTALSYKWDFGDGTYGTDANPVKVYANKGKYTVQLSVSDGTYSSLAVPIVIQAGSAPIVTIGMPLDNSVYRAGDNITVTAAATDAAGFDINDGSLATTIFFHHQTHIHPFLGPLTGRSHTFAIPNTGENSSETWFEIQVSAADTNGLSTTSVVNIYPKKSSFTLNTLLSGASLLLDGIPITPPLTVTGVVGFLREVSAPLVQVVKNVVYQLDHWSDGGALKHYIVTPQIDTGYAATFVQIPPFNGEYFDNVTLSGTPKLTRQDNVIDFIWGNASPDPAIPIDNFSVRWTKTQNFAAGKYVFTATADDGVRLYIDGAIVINQWHDEGSTSYTATVDLAAGKHEIKMEYYERTGGAVAKLTWDVPAGPPPTPTPTVTVTPTPTTIPVAKQVVYDDTLAPLWFDWSWGSTTNIANTSPVFAGKNSLSFIANAPWAGLRFHSSVSLDSTQYKNIKFAAQATNPNQQYAVLLFNPGGMVIGKALPLALYGGNPVPGLWTQYTIPFADFGIGSQKIGDVVIQEWTGGVQPAVYVDEVSLNLPSATPTPTITPSPTATPSPTFAPTPTPTPTVTVLPTPPVTSYAGKYWNLTARATFPPDIPTTQPDLTRTDPNINFTWNDASPAPSIQLDNFVAQWTKEADFAAGTYEFVSESDDGMRVFIDNVLILDQWNDHGLTKFVVESNITAGKHTIRVEYYEHAGGAIAKFSYAKIQTPSATFTGEYFDNQTLSGTPKLTRQDLQVNFVWNNASPDPAIPIDHFSVRWTKTQNFAAGVHNFLLKSDDGMRFWIDNQLLVDDWTDHVVKTYTPSVTLSAGSHIIKIEYYDNSGGAVAIFQEQ